jgi:3-oxocholest-4-en-26-oyl-CoA dehydrogenase beta subunit
MDFGLTEEQEAIRDLATRILTEQVTVERLNALDASEEWLDRQVWEELARSGVLGIALPTEVEGGGLDFLALHLVLEQVGATAAHVPIWPAIVLGALPVARFGTDAQRDLVRSVARGETFLTAALGEDGRDDPLQPSTTAQRTDDGWRIDGLKTQVPIADLAQRVLVPARTAGNGVAVFVLDPAADGVTLTEQEVTSGWPMAELRLDGVEVGDDAVLGDDGTEVLRWLLPRAASGLASMQAGVCDKAVRLSAAYTSTREQFGRPVATFQAVGQRVGDAYIDAQGVQLTALQAAWLLANDLPADDEVAIAKFWAADAGHRVIHAAHHVHGGVGIDMEYELWRYFGLAKQIELTLGSGTQQLLALGRTLAVEPA